MVDIGKYVYICCFEYLQIYKSVEIFNYELDKTDFGYMYRDIYRYIFYDSYLWRSICRYPNAFIR